MSLRSVFLFLNFITLVTYAADCPTEKSDWVGSYYHKIQSPLGFYGIEGLFVVPTFTPDYYCPNLDRTCRYLQSWPDLSAPVSMSGKLVNFVDQTFDASSVYIGFTHKTSSVTVEVDTGLNWGPVYRGKNVRVFVNTTTLEDARLPEYQYLVDFSGVEMKLINPNFEVLASGAELVREKIHQLGLRPFYAFLPFWRDTKWKLEPGFAFLPGERIHIGVVTDGDGNFTLKLFNVDKPSYGFKKTFQMSAAKDTKGVGFKFKRINSIDQFIMIKPDTVVGNEKTFIPDSWVVPTQAKALGGKWIEANLLFKDGSKIPFTMGSCKRVIGVDVWDRADSIYRSSGIDPTSGGETIDIVP